MEGVLLGAYRCQVLLRMNGNAQVVTLVSVEWRHTSGGVWSIIVGKFCQRKKRGPVILLVVAVTAEVLLKGLVDPFSLSISLGVSP